MYTVSDSTDPITTSMGMSVNPTFRFGKEPKPDLIVLPGGNVDPQLENPAVIRWLQENAKSAELVLSVCNGAFFLAKAGLLDGLEATTFAGLIDELREAAPKTRVVTDKRFVDNGKIITAAGLSSGIDGALHVIEKLCGKGTAQVAAVSLEYDWRPDSGYARASLADKRLSPGFDAIREFPSRSIVRHEGTRDRWETSWKIQTDASAASVLQRLDQGFEGTRGAAKLAAGSWKLAGDDGSSWTESTRVTPAEGQAHRLRGHDDGDARRPLGSVLFRTPFRPRAATLGVSLRLNRQGDPWRATSSRSTAGAARWRPPIRRCRCCGSFATGWD